FAIGDAIRGHALIVHAYLLGRFDVVVENHLARAGNQRTTNLDGRQPVKMKMRNEVIRKFHDEISDVLDARLDVATAQRADANRLALDQIIHDQKIVRRQIPEHIDVALKQAEINPDRIEVQQIAELAARNDLLDLSHRTGVHESVIDHKSAPIALCQFD